MPKRRHRWFHRHTPARRQHADNHVSALSFSRRSLPQSTLSETESLEEPLYLGCCLLPVALLHVACCLLRCCMLPVACCAVALLPRSSSDVCGAALSAGYSAPSNQSKCSSYCDITTCVHPNVSLKIGPAYYLLYYFAGASCVRRLPGMKKVGAFYTTSRSFGVPFCQCSRG